MWRIVSIILYSMNMALVIYASVALILRKQDPVKTLSWVLILILLPYIGLILYLFLGRNFRKKKIYNRKGAADFKYKKEFSSQQLIAFKKDPSIFGLSTLPFKKIIYQNLINSYSTVDYNSSVEFYFTGRDALDAMYKSISNAKEHIHFQSYIFVDDITGKRFKELFIKKAQEGVEVRLMFDDVGSFSLKKDFILQMQSYGVEVNIFSKVRLLTPTPLINYRNHRKILIVDGKEGFLGGVNVADRYYYGTKAGDWHDTHMKITGDSVASLQSSFLLDRWFIKNRRLSKRKKYFPSPIQKESHSYTSNNKYITQIISSGPDSYWASIMQCYFTAITSAKDHIYIVTPYFTPSESILNAIKIAALGGIDVKIMLPERSDTIVAHWSTMSYITELLEAGVKVFLFSEGFNHSKVISIDGEMSIVGSANMDCRSFDHNFEIMSVIYNNECANKIEKEFINQIANCKNVHFYKWKKRPLSSKIREGIARLGSPLL